MNCNSICGMLSTVHLLAPLCLYEMLSLIQRTQETIIRRDTGCARATETPRYLIE